LQSNQELAALYLARQQQAPAETPAQPEDQPEAAGDAALAQILSALQQGQSGGSAPPP
jgi:hypothetical protein